MTMLAAQQHAMLPASVPTEARARSASGPPATMYRAVSGRCPMAWPTIGRISDRNRPSGSCEEILSNVVDWAVSQVLGMEALYQLGFKPSHRGRVGKVQYVRRRLLSFQEVDPSIP